MPYLKVNSVLWGLPQTLIYKLMPLAQPVYYEKNMPPLRGGDIGKEADAIIIPPLRGGPTPRLQDLNTNHPEGVA